ncbi:MAG: LicD family protein [Acutalibacteraceae bacterium]|nr:LicD family protein [Acutalibacteraceae bacterium]
MVDLKNKDNQKSDIKMATLEEHQTAMLDLLERLDSICQKYDIPYMLFAGSMLGAVRHKGFIPWDDDVDVVMLRKDYEKFLSVSEIENQGSKYFTQRELSEHWPMYFSKLRLNNTTCLEKYHPKDPLIHQGVYIDIFPCDNASNSAFVRKLQFLSSKIFIARCLDIRGYETNSKAKKLFMLISKLLPIKLLNKFSRFSKYTDTKYVHTFYGGSSKLSKSVYPREWFEKTKRVDFEKKQFPISCYYDELLTLMYGDYMMLPPPELRTCKQHAILVDLNNSYEAYSHFRDDMEFDVFTRSIR